MNGSAILWSASPVSAVLHEIFWLHIPKNGGSFTYTVFGYACPSRKLVIEGQGVHHPRESCGGNISKLQATLTHGNYHTPLIWMSNGRLHPLVGSVVGLFRRPSQRLLSAFYHMREKPWCCTQDWGLSEVSRRQAVNRMRNASELAAAPGMLGCQTKMILGRPCCDLSQPTMAEVGHALTFVRTQMAFVGLTEDWSRSICLWHARFGGPLRHNELRNLRPTHAPTTARDASTRVGEGHHASDVTAGQTDKYDEAELGEFRDRADNALYGAAATRFQREVGALATTVRACMTRLAALSVSVT